MMVFEGIKPVFCDIDYDSFTVDVEDIKEKISSKTRAIVPVHLNGHPANMKEITEIANERNLFIIENAAHALGAKYDNRKVGTIGDLAVFSFAPGKHITTMGDGGMVTTDNKILADKIRMLHNHGRGPIMKSTDKNGFPLHLGNDLIGYNYRMNEINATIGRVQLKKFISGICGPQIRRNHVKEYTDGLENLPIIPPIEKEWAYHSFCRFVVKATKRDKLWLFLRNNGVRVGLPYSPPIHLNRTYMSRFNFVKGMLPITEKVTNEILSLPLRRIEGYPDQETTLKTINTIKKFYTKN
jgi:dTDP-4-amino-4,6-dideoxygalactose transaminase